RALLPPAYARFSLAPRLDRRHRARFHHLVADWARPSLIHTREQKNGLLESGPLVEQDGADAVQDGADEEPDGAPRLRLRRSALERQPRLRRIPRRNAAAPRRGTDRFQGIPRSPAPRQGQGRVRPVHGPAPDPSGAAAPGRSAPGVSRKSQSLRLSAPSQPDGDSAAHLRKQVGGSVLGEAQTLIGGGTRRHVPDAAGGASS